MAKKIKISPVACLSIVVVIVAMAYLFLLREHSWFGLERLSVRTGLFLEEAYSPAFNSEKGFLQSNLLITRKLIPFALNDSVQDVQLTWRLLAFTFGVACFYKIFFCNWRESRSKRLFLSVAVIALLVQAVSCWLSFCLMPRIAHTIHTQVASIQGCENGVFFNDGYTIEYLTLLQVFHVTLIQYLNMLERLFWVLLLSAVAIIATACVPLTAPPAPHKMTS